MTRASLIGWGTLELRLRMGRSGGRDSFFLSAAAVVYRSEALWCSGVECLRPWFQQHMTGYSYINPKANWTYDIITEFSKKL